VTDTSSLRTRILGAFILALGIVIVGGGIGAYGLLNALHQYRTQVVSLSADQVAVLRIESHLPPLLDTVTFFAVPRMCRLLR